MATDDSRRPSGSPAQPVIEPAGMRPNRISMVWLLPVAAIGIAGWLLWQAYLERGPLVRIQFSDAGGVQAGETVIRRNDVDVGRVEAVRLGEDLDSVIVEARLDPSVAPFLDADTRFWIVNARLTTTEVSGLSTLLSGAYIEVDWDAEESDKQSDFVGLSEAPLTKRGTPGLRVTLNAEEAGYIVVGSPVFLRQVEVGRVERRRLSSDGLQVQFEIFVQAPHHRHIHADTRFYTISGVEGQINADGVTVRVESIAAFFTGGIGFETSSSVTEPMPLASRQGQPFKLYDNRRDARESLFENEDDQRFRYSAVFEGSVKGLGVDAPIEYNGLRVGRVVSVANSLPNAPGDRGKATVVLQFQPRRFGIPAITPDAFNERLASFVDSGLRVQLASGNLLTGSLIVKLVDAPAAETATLDFSVKPYASIPTLPSNVEAVTADVETLISNLAALPLNDLVSSATRLLQDTGALVASDDVRDMPQRLAVALESLARTSAQIEMASNDLPTMIRALTRASQNANDVLEGLSPDSEIYLELSSAAREMRNAARSIASFAELLEDNPNAVFTGR